MTDFVGPLLQWLNANPEYAGLATFIISASESVAIIGTIVPGSITMTAIGALAGAGVIPLYATLIWAILGAIVGDGISYWFGHYFKDRLPNTWPFCNYPGFLQTGEKFVNKYGYMSIFIGRFVGPVRALVPLVAGMLGMQPWKFFVANVLSAIGWAPAYMLPGILMGAASLELPPDIAIHVVLVFLLIGLFTLLCLWFLYKFLQWCVYHTTHIQLEIWHWLKRTRYLSFVTNILRHHDQTKTRGQVGLGFYFIDATVLFFLLAIIVKYMGAPNIMVNDAVFHLFRGIRNPVTDEMMLNITLLGQKEILLPAFVLIFASLYLMKNKRAAWHFLALGVIGGASVWFFKHLFRIPRPWGIFNPPSTYSMPSGHGTLAVLFYMGIAFLLACNLPARRSWWVYSLGLIIVFFVSLSRLYLGAHWFTDLVAGWLLATAVMMTIVISYQRKRQDTINSPRLFLITTCVILAGITGYHILFFNKMQVNYALMDYPTFQVNQADWWQQDTNLPAYHVSLFGFPSQAINLEWAGNIKDIEQVLMHQGWSQPPARDFVSILHRIADIRSGQYLSLISPQYLDRNPELTMVRQISGIKNLMILRLWDSNRIIANTHQKIWVGVLGVVPRSYSWIFQSNPGYATINLNVLFPNNSVLSQLEWKMLTLQRTSQRILLVRDKNLSTTH